MGALFLAAHSRAQGVPGDRPGDIRPELPEIEVPEPPPAVVLPPVPAAPPRGRGGAPTGPRMFVRSYAFEGNTAFRDEELADLVSTFAEREIGPSELESVLAAVTRHYVAAGYVNSGATVPDQEPAKGVILIRVIEGTLDEIEIEGNRYFRAGYYERRFALAGGPPLSVPSLEERLQILQQDPRIRRVHAELAPGARRGEARLRVQVEERQPYRLWIEANNYTAPSVGAAGLRFGLSHESLTRNGDRMNAIIRVTEGLWEVHASYEFPITASDTLLRFWYTGGHADVVQSPFDDLDIESDSRTFGVGISHPLVRSLTDTLRVGLNGEVRRSETFLLGRSFSFASGVQDGVSKVTVLRFFQEWIRRDALQVLAFRSQLSWGIDALGATVNPEPLPDGRYLAWLGQFQWARRLPWWGLETLLRANVQLSNDPLLPLEQFAVGGPLSVRGYRTNQLVRDMGADASLELRIPLLQRDDGSPILQLTPFVDYGWSSFRDREIEPRSRSLWGVGIGLRWAITQRATFEVYAAEGLSDVREQTERDLQDRSIYFRLTWNVF